MIYLPSIVSVGFYFEKKRPLATGIAVCGSGIGTFVFPPVLEVLSEMYDWKNLLLIMAGIILNGAVCGMLMRPLIHREESRNSESSSNLSSDSGIKLDKEAIGDTSATAEVYNEAEESTEDDHYSKYGISLFLNIPFLILCIANIFAAIGFFIPFYFLVDRALIMGIPNTNAAFLLSIIGK